MLRMVLSMMIQKTFPRVRKGGCDRSRLLCASLQINPFSCVTLPETPFSKKPCFFLQAPPLLVCKPFFISQLTFLNHTNHLHPNVSCCHFMFFAIMPKRPNDHAWCCLSKGLLTRPTWRLHILVIWKEKVDLWSFFDLI